MKALTAYGGSVPSCACCHISEQTFLVIDHVDGGGNAHRRTIYGKTTSSIYTWLRLNDYPLGFQVLCHNCNYAKSVWGDCPHRAPEPMPGVFQSPARYS
jgi:hypothetical protein